MNRETKRIKRFSEIVLLSALAIGLRVLFGPLANIKPLTAIFLVSISYLGLLPSMVLMAVTMVGSGLLFGFGSFVLWQIISFAVVQLVWRLGMVPFLKKDRLPLWFQSLMAGGLVFLYGLTISFLSAFQIGTHPIVFWLNGLFFDWLHAVSTILFYPIIYHIFRRFYK